MKVITQTDNELALKDGNVGAIITGIVLAVAGVVAGVFFASSSPLTLWIALALFVIGLAVLLFSSSIAVDMNKTGGQITYQKKRLIGGRTATYAIADVLRIETRKQWQMQNNTASGNRGVSLPRQVLVSQSVIVFKDGQELPLDHQKTAGNTSIGPAVIMGGSGTEVAIANQAATFLGVPFVEIGPANPPIGLRL